MRILLLILLFSSSANADFYISGKLGMILNERDTFQVNTTYLTTVNYMSITETRGIKKDVDIDFGHWLVGGYEFGYEFDCFSLMCSIGYGHESKILTESRKEYWKDEVFIRVKYYF